jgi:periplasmic protein CpxP/Spy
MKKLLIVLTVALAGAIAPVATFAQDAAPAAPGGAGGAGGRGARQTPEERVKHLKETLGLTDDQATKIQAIYVAAQEKTKPLREDKSLSQEDRRAKMGEIMKSTQEDVNKVLTPDQQAKLKAEQEKRRAARGNGN